MVALYATEVQSGFYARRLWNVQSRLALHRILVSDIRATKINASEVSIRSVPQYQISPNFLFWGLFRGGRNRKIDYYAEMRYGRGKDIIWSILLIKSYLKWCIHLVEVSILLKKSFAPLTLISLYFKLSIPVKSRKNDLMKLKFSENVSWTHYCWFCKSPVVLRDEIIFGQKPHFWPKNAK